MRERWGRKIDSQIYICICRSIVHKIDFFKLKIYNGKEAKRKKVPR